MRTGAAEDSGDLDELDWDPNHCCQLPVAVCPVRIRSHSLGGIHSDSVERLMFASAEVWS